MSAEVAQETVDDFVVVSTIALPTAARPFLPFLPRRPLVAFSSSTCPPPLTIYSHSYN